MTDIELANNKRDCRMFQHVATNIKHVCGMLLSVKRYIGRNSVMEWALFHLQMQIHSRHDLLFNISSFSKNNMRKDFEKLKSLLSICPRQRTQEILRQIQLCLKKNRAFQGFQDKTQLELCQYVIYQSYESKTLVIKQGHIPQECYIILSGCLASVTEDTRSRKQSTTSLYEVADGDIVGDIALVTGERLTSFVCKSDVELLVIDKEVFSKILAAKVQEEYLSLCHFLRNLPLFSSWPSEKINLLAHCSLRRNHRAGTTVILDSAKSSFLVLIKSGKCQIVVHLTQDRPPTAPETSASYCSIVNRLPTVPFLLERTDSSSYLLEKTVLPRTSYSASYRTVANPKHTRPRPKTAGPSTFSLGYRSNLCELDYTDKRPDDKGRCNQQDVYATTPVRFVTVGTLQQGGVFGLAETINKTSNLHFSLVSEGAECIFIPVKLFLSEAPDKSWQVAQELVNSYPSEKKIRECYNTLQNWSAYKEKLLGKQLNGFKH
ncbi:cyclic nucleotide-binding domain-containing protein 2-like [Pyxicephalus adspersus]|uniref:cyclic nucleotide-binding domain-containing protein 2-like n=1 Tax=Pyxicephalus adspersus TaxID=30357 RepID=UPI003B5AB12D